MAGEAVKQGGRISESYPAAVSISFVLLALQIASLLVGNATLLFFDTLLAGETHAAVWPGNLARACLLLALLVFLINPLRLSVKGWYFSLDGSFHSPQRAFSSFFGFRSYARALWYTLVRQLATFFILFLAAAPAGLLAALLRAEYLKSGGLSGGLEGALLLLALLLAGAGVWFGLYFWMGLFYADYVYAEGKTTNPFRAMGLSFRLTQGKRGRLLLLTARLIPWFLLYLPVATIPFASPKIWSAYAGFAADGLAAQNVYQGKQ